MQTDERSEAAAPESAPAGERARIESIEDELRARGYMLRMTEWLEGFQCGAVLRADTRVAFFSGWRRSALEAWEEVRSLAAARERPATH